jgi:hypothetical protein
MPTVAADRELVQINAPKGTRERLHALCERMRHTADPSAWRDGGLAVAALVGWADEAGDLAQEIGRARAERDELLAERDAARAERDQALRERDEVVWAAAHAGELSREALEVVAAAREAGVPQDDLLAVCQVVKQAGVAPHEFLRSVQETGAPTLLAYARRMAAAVQDAADAAVQAREEAAAAVARRRAEEQRLQQLEAGLAVRRAEVDRAVAATEQRLGALQAVLAELGLYVDFLRSQERPDQAPEVGLALAGVLILAHLEAHGDVTYTIPADALRLVDAPVRLSEIPYLLAKPTTYERMRQVQAARARRAEQMEAGVAQ